MPKVLKLKNGDEYEFPDDATPEQIKKYADGIPSNYGGMFPGFEKLVDEAINIGNDPVTKATVQADTGIPAATQDMVRSGAKSIKDMLFHPIDNAPAWGALAGSTAAALASGGASIPLSIAAAAGGGAGGSLLRSGVNEYNKPEGAVPAKPIDVVNDAVKEGVVNGATAAVPELAMGAGRSVAPTLQSWGRDIYGGALKVPLSVLKSKAGAGSGWEGILKKMEDIAQFGVDNKIRVGKSGLGDSSKIIQNRVKDNNLLIDADTAANGAVLDPRKVETSDAVKRIYDESAKGDYPQQTKPVIDERLKAYLESPNTSTVVKVPGGNKKVWTGMYDAQGNKVYRLEPFEVEQRVGKMQTSRQMQDAKVQEGRELSDMFGTEKNWDVETRKAINNAKKNMLEDQVSGVKQNNEAIAKAVTIRSALENELAKNDISLPSFYMAVTHPALSVGNTAYRMGPVQSRVFGDLGIGMSDLGKFLAQRSNKVTPTVMAGKLAATASDTAKQQDDEQWNKLYEMWKAKRGIK